MSLLREGCITSGNKAENRDSIVPDILSLQSCAKGWDGKTLSS